MHFSSVFMREDTISLPVPETKFTGPEGFVIVGSKDITSRKYISLKYVMVKL